MRFLYAVENNLQEVVCWGTGESVREFLNSEDAARGILLAAQNYNNVSPVNLGTREGITIRRLAKLISELTGYTGNITFNNNGLDGQKARINDIEKAKKEFGFEASIKLKDGIVEMIKHYKENKRNLRSNNIYE
jgi:GDP-L-fucose synthase